MTDEHLRDPRHSGPDLPDSATLLAALRLQGVQRSLILVLGGSALIVWPNRGLSLVVGTTGIVLIAIGLSQLGDRATDAPAARHRAIALGIVAVGAALVLLRGQSDDLLTLLMAGAIAVQALADFVSVARGTIRGFPWVRALRGLGLLLLASFVLFGSDNSVVGAIVMIGIIWVSIGAMTLASILSDPDGLEAAATRATPVLISRWFDRRSGSFDYRDAVFDKLLVEGPDATAQLVRFTVLMLFSTAIATLGVQSDSTAVVIGAMLVAPLMTPIMATSASLVMGWSLAAVRSLLIVAFGVCLAIGCAYLISRYAPGFVSLSENSQISSRTSPTLLDMLIALAAGGAGAYAVTRPDVADSLPGVAIAVALVPPLAVVGVTLAADDPDGAGGAMLLFLTNLVGIVFASGLVFVMSGLVPLQLLRENRDLLRRALTTVTIALLIVSIPLILTGRGIVNDATRETDATEITQRWLRRSPGLRLIRIDIDGAVIEVIVSGVERLPDVDRLADLLDEEVVDDPQVTVRQIPELVETSGTD